MLTRKMKDSGIEWIGEIPEDWDVVLTKRFYKSEKEIVGERESQFERLALTLNGVIKRSKDDGKGLQPAKFETYQILYKDELVFKLIDLENVRTSRVGYSNYTGLVSPVYIRLINSDESKFGYYYFINMWHQEIFNYLGSGVRSNLTAKDLLNVPYLDFREIEKRKIVQKLESKTKNIKLLIEQTEQSIEELKKYKQSLITEAVTKGLNPNVEMKDSGIEWIGKIPEHWEVFSPFRVLKVIRGNTSFKKDDMKSSGDYVAVQYGQIYQLKEVTDGYDKYIDAEFYKEDQEVLYGDTILVSTSETIEDLGHSCYYNRIDTGLLGGEQLLLRPKSSNIDNKFLYYASTYFQNDLQQFATGIKVYRFNIGDLKKIRMVIPPIKEQKEISRKLDKEINTINKLIEDKQEVIEELESYKKSLIYEYVTGKKTV